jgi:hypothetical protein
MNYLEDIGLACIQTETDHQEPESALEPDLIGSAGCYPLAPLVPFIDFDSTQD